MFNGFGTYSGEKEQFLQVITAHPQVYEGYGYVYLYTGN